MFCPNCGTSLADSAEFCGNCGYNLKAGRAYQARPQTPYAPAQPYSQPYLGASMKSEALSIILAILIPGSGHLYVGRLTRGLVILISYFGLSVLGMVLLFSAIPGFFTGDLSDASLETSVLISLTILSVISLIIWVVQLIDVYNLTKQYNDTLRRTGQPPW